ncbi:DUF3813 domain-containing protein [Bacillus sp. CLL-7-23]|uniref:DUF3813 domain-containing protein n=1 Tax=Bacillus changyiensis TaxID=3004103 RepID=A0ABT4X1K7_9BACI|nr:DUF3813 domain-containing protein [Bacillus changyiensis]MDA7026065.1 DUF3813 domain-containing protein [Bacillus changyiensis]
MRNELFQMAQHAVHEAVTSTESNRKRAIERAQNALSSAYANSTDPERQELHALQDQLERLS